MNSYLAVVEASGLLVVLRLGVQSCCLLSVQFSEHRYVTNNQQLKVDKSSFFVLRMSRSISDGVRTTLPNPFHRPHQPANAATPTAPRSRTRRRSAAAAAGMSSASSAAAQAIAATRGAEQKQEIQRTRGSSPRRGQGGRGVSFRFRSRRHLCRGVAGALWRSWAFALCSCPFASAERALEGAVLRHLFEFFKRLLCFFSVIVHTPISGHWCTDSENWAFGRTRTPSLLGPNSIVVQEHLF